MENASKALLIAASVLIVILLIAFGMKIFNSTSGTTDQVEGAMDSTEIAMFNNKFIPYIGNNNSKAQIQSLLNLIIVNNSTNSHKIKVLYGTGEAFSDEINKIRDMMSEIANSNKKVFQVHNIGSAAEFEAVKGRIFKLQIIGM